MALRPSTALFAAALAVAVAVPARAADDEIPVRRVGVALAGKELIASFGVGDAFSPAVRKKMRSGLPVQLAIQINLEREGKSSPVSFWARAVNVVYDLWEENFIVTVEDERGKRRAKVGTVDEAISLASTVAKEQIANIALLTPGVHRLHVLVEVNPVSAQMVENIRRWLARPPAGRSGVESQSSFFGSFVGIFVDRRIGESDRTVVFVSQWFKLGEGR